MEARELSVWIGGKFSDYILQSQGMHFCFIVFKRLKNETKHLLLGLKSPKMVTPAQLHLNVLENGSWTDYRLMYLYFNE